MAVLLTLATKNTQHPCQLLPTRDLDQKDDGGGGATLAVGTMVSEVLNHGKLNSETIVLFAMGRPGGSASSITTGKVSIFVILLMIMMHWQHLRQK